VLKKVWSLFVCEFGERRKEKEMKKNSLLVFLTFLLVFFFSGQSITQVNEYSLQPVDIRIAPDDSTVQFNINIKTRDTIGLFQVPLYAEGTSNPVLDTILTGGLSDPNPPAFALPSLVSNFVTRYVNPYGPPSDPLLFMAHDYATPLPPDTGLLYRMFYKVSGPGTLTFRTAEHSTAGAVSMVKPDSTPVAINWPVTGTVDSFDLKINGYILDPVDLQISPCDSVVQVNINIKIEDPGLWYCVTVLVVALFAEGTSNPVLDTFLTGPVYFEHPAAFLPPSLVYNFIGTHFDPYGPPQDPLVFYAVGLGCCGVVPGDSGLFCRMFYDVSGPGTLTFRTAVHSFYGPTTMEGWDWSVSINWPAAGEVGSFNVTAVPPQRGNVNCDGQVNVTDVIYIIAYLFKGGLSPRPLDSGDANCDSKVTVADVVYLINYLFKGGPPPC
jgi:hypothetical protein